MAHVRREVAGGTVVTAWTANGAVDDLAPQVRQEAYVGIKVSDVMIAIDA